MNSMFRTSRPHSSLPVKHSALISQLQSHCGEAQVLTKDEDLIPYSFDGTAALQQRPTCVVFPRTPPRSPPA